MRFAYADPPYIGLAHRYAEKQEVDHAVLITRLTVEYPDGWALSLHVPSLRRILTLCPEDVRILAWVKPWASFKPTLRVAYAWEPVILRGGRPRERGDRATVTVRDWLSESSTRMLTFPDGQPAIGAKPEVFCRWILDCLGFQDGDLIDDLYPGTGIMGHVAKQLLIPLQNPTAQAAEPMQLLASKRQEV